METLDGVNPVEVLAALGVEAPDRIERVFGGADTLLWRIERAGSTYALRVFRAEQAGVDEDEMRAMEVAREAGLPVPRVEGHALWRDRPALLLSWCPGATVAEAALGDAAAGSALLVDLGRVHARMHEVRVSPELHGPNHGWVGRAGSDERELQAALLALNLEPHALLHLDYHPLNVMAGGGHISCILDWANADAGDPRADIARTHTILLLSPVPPGASITVTDEVRRSLVDAWWHGYTEVAGEPEEMPLFYAWAGAYMARDLGAKIGRPGSWIDETHLEPIRRFTADWKVRAGLSK